MIEIQGLERIYRTTTEGWKTVPMWSIATRKDRKGYAEAELLSVYREFGVICKSDRDDNHNVESEDLSSYKFVKRGDLVLNKMKTWQGSLGVSKFEGIVSPAYFVCELSTDVHGPFIHYLLRSKPYIAMYGAASKGIRVGQWDLPYEEFRDLPVLLPPIEEQRRIADYLDEQKIQMDKILSAREKQMDSLSLLLRSQIDHDLRDTAAEIDQMRLSLLLYKITTGTTPDSTLNDPDGLPWYSPASISALGKLGEQIRNISPNVLGDARWVNFPADSVLIVGIGGTSGRVAYLDHEATGNQQLTCLTPNGKILPKFLFYYLMSKKNELLALANYTTLPILNNDFLKSLLIPTPSLAMQRGLVDRWRELEKSANELGFQISAFRDLQVEYLKSLITAAVTGQFDVTTGRSVA